MVKKVVVKRKWLNCICNQWKTFNVFWNEKKKLIDGDSFNIKINLKNGTSQNIRTMVLNKNLKSNYSIKMKPKTLHSTSVVIETLVLIVLIF